MHKKIHVIVQARMSSSRFPKKIFEKINDQTILSFVISQISKSKKIDRIIIATTTLEEDDVIVEFCKNNNIDFFRGSVDDVLDRYFECAKKFSSELIVRISSDCPFIDPEMALNEAQKIGNPEHIKKVKEHVKTINESYGKHYKELGVDLEALL